MNKKVVELQQLLVTQEKAQAGSPEPSRAMENIRSAKEELEALRLRDKEHQTQLKYLERALRDADRERKLYKLYKDFQQLYTGVDYALLHPMELVKDRIRDQHWKRIPKAFGGQPTVEIAMRYAALLSVKFGAERRDFRQKLLRWKNGRNLFCHKPCAPDALQRRQHMLDMLRNVLAIINKILRSSE